VNFKNSCEQVCKPGSVLDNHLSEAGRYRTALATVPEAGRATPCGKMPQLQFGLAPNGVYIAPLVAKRPVSSYLAFPPSPIGCPTGSLFLLHYP